MSENHWCSGYIRRNHLEKHLIYAIEDASKMVINPDTPNAAYEIGKSLGYTDGLKAALKLIKDLSDDPKPAQRIIYSKPETFPD